MVSFNDLYPIGRIGKPHGVHGEVQMQVNDDVFDRTATPYIFIEVDGLPVPFFFTDYRFRGPQSALVNFEGIDTEQAARRLSGCTVWFERSLADTDEDTNDTALIIGYRLIDAETNNSLGTIHAINDTTVNMLFEVENSDGTDRLIPVVEEWITAIDHDEHTITMLLPEGLLEL